MPLSTSTSPWNDDRPPPLGGSSSQARRSRDDVRQRALLGGAGLHRWRRQVDPDARRRRTHREAPGLVQQPGRDRGLRPDLRLGGAGQRDDELGPLPRPGRREHSARLRPRVLRRPLKHRGEGLGLQPQRTAAQRPRRVPPAHRHWF